VREAKKIKGRGRKGGQKFMAASMRMYV